ncbi:hypothetical protein D1818_01070 [Aquimarina sp. BL5]|uniref:hypothetical protein n=1 Tax=Aquimarina sp. BL5 TaxID=1714860 RepID=UPI000E4EC64D|nr:hypothetical protein [Aquimarina sp. BL5]AXT49477.1 hypothetical protein D1818_01070 [Aquimarina sp. BL5]RKN04373.1 hypothetical protein D7036_12315 [Aquimarina sp. BL5]
MSNTKKKAYQILVISTCIVALFVSFIFLKSRYDTNKEAKITKLKAKKDVIQDLDYQYAKLKYAARDWSTLYAKITTVHNRDTIEHPKYTVADLPFKHSDIVRFWDRFEEDVYIRNYVTDEAYLSEIYKVGDTLRNVSKVYKVKNKISEYLESLNMAYTGILNNASKTDSVSKYSSRSDPKFGTYFYYLEKIDRAYYELLSEHYPTALHNLIYGTKKFEKDAVNNLISRQIQELNTQWRYSKNREMKEFKKHMKAYLGVEKDSLNTYILKKNDSKLLLLVKTLQFKEDDNLALKKAYLEALTEGFHLIRDQYTKEIYIYLEFFNEETYYIDRWVKTPNEAYSRVDDLDNVSRILSNFYEVDAYQYYIKGSFPILDVWYPNYKAFTVE